MNVGSLSGSASTTTNIELGSSNTSSTAINLGQMSIRIPLYANTTYNKSCFFFAGSINPSGIQSGAGFGRFASTSAITSVTLFPDAGNFDAGDVLIYGVK
jgi:hypothetical protein